MIKVISNFRSRLTPNLNKILTNVLWLTADKFIYMGLSLFLGVWLARYLGAEQYGIYSYSIAFISLFTPIAKMGIHNIIVRDLSQNVRSKNVLLGTAFAVSLIGSIVSLILVNIFSLILNEGFDQRTFLIAISSISLLFFPFEVISYWFQSRVESKNVVIAKRFSYFAVFTAKIGFILARASLSIFLAMYSLQIALGSFGLILMYLRKGEKLVDWSVSWKQMVSMLKEGFPLIFAGLAVYVYSKIDQIMLGTLISDQSQLGFYSVSVKLSEIFDFLPIILATSVLPRFSQLKAGNHIQNKNFQVYFDVMTVIWLSLAMPISLVSTPIISLLFGESYLEAGPMLSLYIWAQFGTCFGVARTTFLTVESKLYYTLPISLLGALTNIILNYFLIPKYEAFGAIFATIITYFIVTILINFLVKDLKPVGWAILKSFNFPASFLRIKRMVGEQANH